MPERSALVALSTLWSVITGHHRRSLDPVTRSSARTLRLGVNTPRRCWPTKRAGEETSGLMAQKRVQAASNYFIECFINIIYVLSLSLSLSRQARLSAGIDFVTSSDCSCLTALILSDFNLLDSQAATFRAPFGEKLEKSEISLKFKVYWLICLPICRAKQIRPTMI